MEDIQTIITCPLGSKCREVKDNKVHQCAWYVKLYGKDPQSDKKIDEWRCAMSWMPIMMVENAQTNRGQTQAIETFRNAVVNQNNVLQRTIINHAQSNIADGKIQHIEASRE